MRYHSTSGLNPIYLAGADHTADGGGAIAGHSQAPRGSEPRRTALAPRNPRSTFRTRRENFRESGSALILALVTIVMLVMLGAAYLQVARTDRRTAAAVDTRTNQSDASILRYIGQILAGDLPEGIDGTGPEAFDVAWSNPAEPWTVPDIFAPTVVPGPVPILTNGDQPAREPRANTALPDRTTNYVAGPGAVYQAQGGDRDDPYLGSTEPDFSGGTPYWPHVTNLLGVFLDLGDIAATNDTVPGGVRPLPAQYLATAQGTAGWTPTANQLRSDVAYTVPAIQMGTIPLAAAGLYADADGDDIADSRWTWAPLPSDGGQVFVMAVRIVDNSALLNVNALSYQRPSGDAPRWLWPGELDLDTALEGIKARASAGSMVSNNILYNTAPSGRYLAANTFNARLDNWLYSVNTNRTGWNDLGTALEKAGTVDGGESPVDPANTYNSYNVRSEELELRWRNGLNRSTNNTTVDADTPFETLDGTLFRSAALETDYVASGYGTAGNTSANIGPFFVEEPRKQMTTVSGSAAFAQVNLNSAGLVAMSNALDSPSMALSSNLIPVDARTPALYAYGGWTNNEEFTDQMACILTDFRDENSELTFRNDMFGMEYLPFISEVYLQARYDKGTVTSPGVSGNDEVEWTHTPGNYALAIEIVNPWPWEIAMPDVEVFVQDDAGVSQSMGTLDTLTAGKTTMTAHEVIILRKDDALPAANAELPASAFADMSTTTAPFPNWPDGTGVAGLVLAAQTSVGNRVGYQEFAVEEIPTPIIEWYTVGAGAAAGATGYSQVSALGTGNGLSALTVRDVDVEVKLLDPTNSIPGGERRVQHSNPQAAGDQEFNNYLKNATSPDRTDALDTRVTDAADAAVPATPASGDEPWIVGNAGRFYRTGDLLRAVFLGPRVVGAVQIPVAEVWETFRANEETATGTPTQHSIGSLMLDVEDPARVDTNNLDMPHAAYYLARFNTIDVNNAAGGLIDGLPNINTIPQRLLAEILPTTNLATAATIAAEIVAAREAPSGITAPGIGRPANLKGIAHLSQFTVRSSAIYDGTATPAAEVTDFNELDPEATHVYNTTPGPGTAVTTDAYTNDTEEKTLLLSALNQVVSTRSDIFTAYVLVRSYPANDFGLNGFDAAGEPIPTDEFRLIAVFDRSSVTGDGLPRILAVKRFAD